MPVQMRIIFIGFRANAHDMAGVSKISCTYIHTLKMYYFVMLLSHALYLILHFGLVQVGRI